VVHRKQLDGRHTQVEQVGDRRLVGQPGVRAATFGRDLGVCRGEALDVDLVDDRVGVAAAGTRLLGGPPVVVTGHQAARDVAGGVQGARGVGVVGYVAEDLRAEADLAADRPGVGVEQQLRRIAA